MSPSPHGSTDDEVMKLTQAQCNGALGDQDAARLESLLLESAESRAFFRRYLALDSALRDRNDGAIPSDPSTPAVRSPSVVRTLRAGLLGAGLLAGLVFLILGLARSSANESIIGRLEQIAGDVRVLGADGAVRAVAADGPLRSGDTVRTRGPQSSSSLVYPDGTRLTLVGDASVTCGGQRSRSVVVHQGTLAASVEPQPPEQPMLLATPAAQVQVLGTRFLIEALADRTDLSVSAGRVRMVRVRDGEAVEVANGKYAVVTDQNRLVARDVPGLATDWEADFEDGLPQDWETGELVTRGLPPGSSGAVACVREDDPGTEGGSLWVIRSTNHWLQGLFAARRTSHLHFTYKVANRKWFNVFIQTRTADSRDPQFSANYLFRDLPRVREGVWHTASIPLSRFRRLAGGNPPLEELVPFRVMLSADGDRGLVIDRIWVTADGPGKVEVRPLNVEGLKR